MLPARRRRRVEGDDSATKDGYTDMERVCILLRDLQWQTNCSSKTLEKLLTAIRDGKLGDLIRKQVELPKHVTYADKKCNKKVCKKFLMLIFDVNF